jgi:hypothetical protein
MYKKGKIREERVNRKDIVEVSEVTIEELVYLKYIIFILSCFN